MFKRVGRFWREWGQWQIWRGSFWDFALLTRVFIILCNIDIWNGICRLTLFGWKWDAIPLCYWEIIKMKSFKQQTWDDIFRTDSSHFTIWHLIIEFLFFWLILNSDSWTWWLSQTGCGGSWIADSICGAHKRFSVIRR